MREIKNLLNQSNILEDIFNKIYEDISAPKLVGFKDFFKILFGKKNNLSIYEILFYPENLNFSIFDFYYSQRHFLDVSFFISSFKVLSVSASFGYSFANFLIYMTHFFFKTKIKVHYCEKTKEDTLDSVVNLEHWASDYYYNSKKIIEKLNLPSEIEESILNLRHPDPTFLIIFFHNLSYSVRIEKSVSFEEIYLKTNNYFDRLMFFLENK